ncbi:MAG: hypothetical protein A2474_05535 [Elusimicrobia bacterium RIFOXYC2_FULL_34_12]|nr:MAG: hypothetical protein A2474_05535 [Elusimicrobia bacterium RIFOXYC2_FULL_34_12]OGS39412.1 MAG: hypothetical protein A2551_01975 [Elusimicrobia bacterium RIFOXYD2_FULL_34_30]HAM38779.1 hypothetical protein [Elusimicrobiota bacterium]
MAGIGIGIMEEDMMTEILKIVISPSGAVIVFIILLLIVFLVDRNWLRNILSKKIEYKGIISEQSEEFDKQKTENMESHQEKIVEEPKTVSHEEGTLFKYIFDKDFDKSEFDKRLGNIIKNTSQKEQAKKRFEFLYFLELGNKVDLYNDILSFVQDNNKSFYSWALLGFEQQKRELKKDAITSFKLALSFRDEVVDDTFDAKIEVIKRLSLLIWEIEGNNEAYDFLQTEINNASKNQLKSNLYKQLAELKKKSDKEESNLFEEYQQLRKEAFKLLPNDKGLLFSIAYDYGKKNEQKKSIYYYKTLLKIDANNDSALNNMGVAYERLGIINKAILFYKKAAQLGSYYSMGNLAIMLTNAGFFEEAQEWINKARKEARIVDNPDLTRIIYAENFLQEKRLEEVKETEQIEKDYK